MDKFVKTIVSRGHHSMTLTTQEVFGPSGGVAIERANVEFFTEQKKKKYDIKWVSLHRGQVFLASKRNSFLFENEQRAPV